ncbi:DUF389 domain-containing protein [Altererythrobacter sp. B11]|uniref:DUF389 domain-containing protein n=1 Tax=Altererythrobacter sp. B11 TaxID=2060312 RepID=UPI001E2F1216|nr:DUF389 domain-containing protein [Altererythrobacter sp. B11]
MSETATDPANGTNGFRDVVYSWLHWWRTDVVGTVNQAEVIARRREECGLSARYLLMLAMSAGIAILGLLLSSPAVVIGAMLLSPLMGPIMGAGFGLAIGDFRWIKQSSRSLVVGTLLSVGFCALVVMLSPLQTVTSEIAARTKPNLFDLLVALFSAIAGAYAMIRGREGTVVGVAIATALMPPLAVVGFGLATFNWTVFSGALMLFVTNLMTIAFTAAVMARLYGFRTTLSDRQTQFQTVLIIAAFVALAIPLGISLRQIAWESNATRQINAAVADAFDDRARLSQIDVNYNTQPIQVSATVLTPELKSDAERVIARATSRRIGAPVEVKLTQYRVGTDAQAAEVAQLAAVQAQREADLQRAEELAERLALVAGVPDSEVLVDRERRRATVRAKPLDGASLGAYFELERRISGQEPEWTVQLVPPARPLPPIAFEDDAMTDRGAEALALTVWAAERIGAPVVISGPTDAVEAVRAALAAKGVAVIARPKGSGYGEVTLRWAAPDESPSADTGE